MNKKSIIHLLLIINCNLLFCQNPIKEIAFESDYGGFYGWQGYIGKETNLTNADGLQGIFKSPENDPLWTSTSLDNWTIKALYSGSLYPNVLPNSSFVFNTFDKANGVENVRFARIYKGMPDEESNRISTIQRNANGDFSDVITGVSLKSPNGSEHIVRLGNLEYGLRFSQRLSYTFTVTDVTKYILYNYAMVLRDPGHPGRPYFYVDVIGNDCSKTFYYADNTVFGDLKYKDGYYYKDWSSQIIDLSAYKKGEEVTVTFITSDCNGMHSGYAYFDAMFVNSSINIENEKCRGSNLEISCSATGIYKNETYLWDFGDGETSSDATPTHMYSKEGEYVISLKISNPDVRIGCKTRTVYDTIVINKRCSSEELTCTSCTSCSSDFAPAPGKQYVLSAWVKDALELTKGAASYDNCSVLLTFEMADLTQQVDTVRPSGSIIDGWQRIQKEFTVPASACKMNIRLNNAGNNQDVFFDDVRVLPFNASMKSYVYDPQTLRLSAELDDNNYATFYEYDEEGALVRVKKETEKGVMTIKEARQGKPKK